MKKKEIPIFKNEGAEREFWLTHDSSEYIDWSKAKQVNVPNLKPSTENISLRLPKNLLNDLKIIANKQDIPYQSLIKILLSREVKLFRDRL